MSEQGKKRFFSKENLLVFFINNKSVMLLILLCIAAQISSGGIFLKYSNLSSVTRQAAVMCLQALGFTCVLTCGNLDLSIGHMLSLLCVSYAMMTKVLPLPLAIIFTILIGVTCGFINGFFSIRVGLTPFIVTLATAQIYRGIAYLLCGGISIGDLSPAVKYLGQGILFGFLPISLVFVLLFMVIMIIVVYRTKFGRHIIATGGNMEAARVSGVNIKAIKHSTFIIMGTFNALAAIIITGRVSIAMPSVGEGMEMDAIAAVIIGGTALSGGKPNVVGSIFGCFILGIISNLLNLAGVSSFWQWVTKGIIILAAIFIDSKTESFFTKRTRKSLA